MVLVVMGEELNIHHEFLLQIYIINLDSNVSIESMVFLPNYYSPLHDPQIIKIVTLQFIGGIDAIFVDIFILSIYTL